MTPNENAFLTMIAVSEGTATRGDRGYNILVGFGQFKSYADHPRRRVVMRDKNGNPKPDLVNGGNLVSTAAGRYQFKVTTWDDVKAKLKLADFSPASQDAACLYVINNWCKAGDDVRAGRIAAAISKCRTTWASFPGAGYSQRENPLDALLAAYRRAGGILA